MKNLVSDAEEVTLGNLLGNMVEQSRPDGISVKQCGYVFKLLPLCNVAQVVSEWITANLVSNIQSLDMNYCTPGKN